jgi:hypothetical protein
MNSELNSFFKEEQKHVFEPGPYFTQRVMAQLASAKEKLAPSIWEVLPNAMRPIMAVALVLLFGVLAVQILVPVEPARGPYEALMRNDLTPREQMLLVDPQTTAGAAEIEEFLILEPLQ